MRCLHQRPATETRGQERRQADDEAYRGAQVHDQQDVMVERADAAYERTACQHARERGGEQPVGEPLADAEPREQDGLFALRRIVRAHARGLSARPGLRAMASASVGQVATAWRACVRSLPLTGSGSMIG